MPHLLLDIHTHSKEEPIQEGERRLISFALGRDSFVLNDKRRYSVGYHPWYLPHDDLESSLDKLIEYASQPPVVAIGECGLDKLCETTKKLQLYFFEQQLILATELQKPLILHVVKSWEEVLKSIKKCKVSSPLIVHGFRGKPQLAQQLIDKGFYLSFGESFHPDSMLLTFESERLFLETDTSSLSIQEIYNNASKVLQVSEEHLQESLARTASQVGLIL